MPSFRNSAEGMAPRGLGSVTWAVDPGRIPELVRALDPALIFEDPAGERLYGLGQSAVLEASATPWELAERAIEILDAMPIDGEAPRFLGGFAFDPERSSSGPWSGFPSGRFVLPELLLSDRGHAIAVTRLGDPGRLKVLRGLLDTTLGTSTASATCVRALPADPAPWHRGVAAALERIRSGAIQKVVMARPIEVELDRPLTSAGAVEALRKLHPDCFRFAFRHGGKLFAGATPELLFRRQGSELQTMALAGTARRDPDPLRDQALGAQLLADEKERREHALVVDAIRSGLEPLSASLHLEGPVLRRLANVQHLQTNIRAALRAHVRASTLLEQLHPTPAVCGAPRSEARTLLRELEPFDRGWYAGPIGAVGRSRSTFAVALRCLLAEGTRARIFVGAGIVAGSDADREWRETQTKSLAVLRALGHDGSP